MKRINEAGAFSAWTSLATSYSTNKLPMIPFYIYYSMFGFQRIHDLAWAAGDARAEDFIRCNFWKNYIKWRRSSASRWP